MNKETSNLDLYSQLIDVDFFYFVMIMYYIEILKKIPPFPFKTVFRYSFDIMTTLFDKIQPKLEDIGIIK